MPDSGLGTSSQTFNAAGNANQSSRTNPWPPAQNSLRDIIGQANSLYGMQQGGQRDVGAGLSSQEAGNYYQALANVNQLPNFGPSAANTAKQFINTGGDPTGILHQERTNLSPVAGQNLDPRQTPGMQDVLNTIRNDISNQVNGQFAGAGRSLSGLNTQTLARGISQGEAVPLLNQYNQNWANKLGANQELGNVQGKAVSNIGQGYNYAQMAPMLAQLNPMMAEQITQQANMQPFNYLAQRENLINPIAGLGGTATGQQANTQSGSGTATSSLLSQLGQALGLLGPIGKFAGTF